jgi:hypothetical protein
MVTRFSYTARDAKADRQGKKAVSALVIHG